MVLVCLSSDALSQHLPSYLGFSYLGRRLSLHACSSKVQPLLHTLDEGYLLTAAPPDLEHGVAPLCPPSSTNTQSLLKLISIESVMPSNHLIFCCPILLLSSIFPSIGVFSNESVLCIRWPRYWSFSFSFSPSNEYSGLTSFSIDWFDLLAVQGTLKSVLQYYSSKASIFKCSAFFMVQLSHPYMTNGKNHTFD